MEGRSRFAKDGLLMKDGIDYNSIDGQIAPKIWMWARENVIIAAHLNRWLTETRGHTQGNELKGLSVPDLYCNMIESLGENTREILDRLPESPLSGLTAALGMPSPQRRNDDSLADWEERLLACLTIALKLNLSAQQAFHQHLNFRSPPVVSVNPIAGMIDMT